MCVSPVFHPQYFLSRFFTAKDCTSISLHRSKSYNLALTRSSLKPVLSSSLRTIALLCILSRKILCAPLCSNSVFLCCCMYEFSSGLFVPYPRCNISAVPQHSARQQGYLYLYLYLYLHLYLYACLCLCAVRW